MDKRCVFSFCFCLTINVFIVYRHSPLVPYTRIDWHRISRMIWL